MDRVRRFLRELWEDATSPLSLLEILVGAFGTLGLSWLAVVTVLRNWWASLAPVQQQLSFIVVLTAAAVLTGSVVLWRRRRKRLQDWPVLMFPALAGSHDAVLLRVQNKVESEEWKAVVSWMGSPFLLTPPFSLRWEDVPGEYRHVPSGAVDKAMLLKFEYQGEPVRSGSRPHVLVTVEDAAGNDSQALYPLSNFWNPSEEDCLAAELGFRVAVVGKDAGMKREFRVHVRFVAELDSPQRVRVEAEVFDGAPGGYSPHSFHVLYHEGKLSRIAGASP